MTADTTVDRRSLPEFQRDKAYGLSRRQALASIPAAAAVITPAGELTANAAHGPNLAGDDPVFAAIERHCTLEDA